eukprot:scaffold8708_cov179-Ochromonas_danica.AAC.12
MTKGSKSSGNSSLENTKQTIVEKDEVSPFQSSRVPAFVMSATICYLAELYVAVLIIVIRGHVDFELWTIMGGASWGIWSFYDDKTGSMRWVLNLFGIPVKNVFMQELITSIFLTFFIILAQLGINHHFYSILAATINTIVVNRFILKRMIFPQKDMKTEQATTSFDVIYKLVSVTMQALVMALLSVGSPLMRLQMALIVIAISSIGMMFVGQVYSRPMRRVTSDQTQQHKLLSFLSQIPSQKEIMENQKFLEETCELLKGAFAHNFSVDNVSESTSRPSSKEHHKPPPERGISRNKSK